MALDLHSCLLTCKTVLQTLDCDLHVDLSSVMYGANTSTFCAQNMIVSRQYMYTIDPYNILLL